MRTRCAAACLFRRQTGANNIHLQHVNYLKYRPANQGIAAEDIALSLDKGKCIGKNKYRACCPAHNDKNPSLSITETIDGKVLVHCFSGCSQEEVIEALRNSGLWISCDSRKTNLFFNQPDYEYYEMIVNIAISDLETGNCKKWTKEDPHTILEAVEMLGIIRRLK